MSVSYKQMNIFPGGGGEEKRSRRSTIIRCLYKRYEGSLKNVIVPNNFGEDCRYEIEIKKNCLYYSLVKALNDTPAAFRDLPTLNRFKKQLITFNGLDSKLEYVPLQEQHSIAVKVFIVSYIFLLKVVFRIKRMLHWNEMINE